MAAVQGIKYFKISKAGWDCKSRRDEEQNARLKTINIYLVFDCFWS